MKLLAFKFQEEKCVVLGEDDQVARGAPPPAPGGRREPTCRRQGGGGGDHRLSHCQGASPRGLQGPLKYSVVKQHTSQAFRSAPAPPRCCALSLTD